MKNLLILQVSKMLTDVHTNKGHSKNISKRSSNSQQASVPACSTDHPNAEERGTFLKGAKQIHSLKRNGNLLVIRQNVNCKHWQPSQVLSSLNLLVLRSTKNKCIFPCNTLWRYSSLKFQAFPALSFNGNNMCILKAHIWINSNPEVFRLFSTEISWNIILIISNRNINVGTKGA